MHNKMVENDTTNPNPTVKQEMQVDTETDDLKINNEMKTEISEEIKTECVELINEDCFKSKNDEKPELISNNLKRKRVRGKRRRPPKSIRLINLGLMPDKKQTTDSKPTPNAEKLSVSAASGVEGSSNDLTTYDDIQDDVEYVLTVSNLPNTWSFMDIKNYIDTECEPVDEMELLKDKKTGNGAIRLSYQSETQAKNTMNKLKDKVIEGHKLIVEMTVETLESDPEDEPDSNESSWKPDMDDWDIDPKGLYGLKEEFLKSLKIEPPLDRWVGVSNFKCDKQQLRDIMEMAGKVIQLTLFSVTDKYARVMYSHPLEAVQAVSMLHNQQYDGIALHVNMIRTPSETVLLPKGLASIGKGLGINGKPLRNIKKHYKKLVAKEHSLINPTIFNVPESFTEKVPEVNFKVRGVEILDKSFDNNIQNSKEQAPPAKTQVKPPAKPQKSIPIVNRHQMSHVPRPTNPQSMQQNFARPNVPNVPFQRPNMARPMGPYGAGPRPMVPFGPDPRMMRPYGNAWNNVGPQGPMHGPGPMGGPMRGPMPGPMPGPCRPMQGPMQAPVRPIIYNTNDPVQLQLSNLPPTTTFNILSEKMAQCGQIVSMQLTTPGCAVVTFANRMQAENCIKTYNGTFVDGCTIQVKYT